MGRTVRGSGRVSQKSKFATNANTCNDQVGILLEHLSFTSFVHPLIACSSVDVAGDGEPAIASKMESFQVKFIEYALGSTWYDRQHHN
jgi:hypothetical protein